MSSVRHYMHFEYVDGHPVVAVFVWYEDGNVYEKRVPL